MKAHRFPSAFQAHTLVTLLPIALGTWSCSKSPPLGAGDTAAGGRDAAIAGAAGYGSGAFYPLELGNRWSYAGGGTLAVLGGSDPEITYTFIESHRLIGTTLHEGTRYVVEEQVQDDPDSYYGPNTGWIRLRQTHEGLFSLDTLLQETPVLEGSRFAVSASPARGLSPYRLDLAALEGDLARDPSIQRLARRVEMLRAIVRGALPHDSSSPAGLELRLLVYPLRPGETWSSRPDFPWPFRVDRVEMLDTPAGRFPAYRIEITPGGIPLQEGEWVRVWYARQGYLGYSIHTFLEGTDVNGNPTGIVYVGDDWMRVTSIQIER